MSILLENTTEEYYKIASVTISILLVLIDNRSELVKKWNSKIDNDHLRRPISRDLVLSEK